MNSFPLNHPEGAPLVTLSEPADHVIQLTMHTEENRFTYSFCEALHQALDEVDRRILKVREEGPSPLALVTVGEGRIFSNGLDLQSIVGTSLDFFVNQFHPLLRRILLLPIPTVAAINGHAFAGGCMFAVAHDYRVMRSDRGFLCMNEVDLPGSLTPGMASILRAKFPSPHILRDCILQARRFPASEALPLGLIDVAVPEKEVLPAAIALAGKWAPKAEAGMVYSWLKEEIWRDAADHLGSSLVGYAKL